MDLGPNMKRLRDMEVAGTLRACVIAGPGDLMFWDVCATVERDGLTIDVIGRGSDLEAAAALAIAFLSRDAARPAVPDADTATLPPDNREVL